MLHVSALQMLEPSKYFLQQLAKNNEITAQTLSEHGLPAFLHCYKFQLHVHRSQMIYSLHHV